MSSLIKCPECGYSEDLVIFLKGEAQMRVPVRDGSMILNQDFMLDARVPGITTISVSSLDGARIVLYPEIEMTLHCPKCEKAFSSRVNTPECDAAK